jgi:hypothetical protein
VVRQQVFLAGLAGKVLSAGTLADPAKLSGLIGAITKLVVLDQGWDVLGFAGQMKGLTGGKIEFRTIPTGRPDRPTPADGDAVEVDPRQVRDFVRSLTGAPVAGPAATPGTPAPTAATSVPGAARITVEVRNGSGVGEATTALTAQGFGNGGAANAAALAHRTSPAATGSARTARSGTAGEWWWARRSRASAADRRSASSRR